MRTIITAVLMAMIMTATAQEESIMTPLNLPHAEDTDSYKCNYFHGYMKLEGRTLYVPTSNGIYRIDLDNTSAGWTLQGFEGEKIVEFVHNGDQWLAITRNKANRLLLISEDGGKTITDATPQSFITDSHTTIARIVQHPTQPNTIYAGSLYFGMQKSLDFGQTWEAIGDYCFANVTYFGLQLHPLDPNIIVNTGENFGMQAGWQISEDGGDTWETYYLPDDVYAGDNCIHQIAFHPDDINTWIFGGEEIICKSNDKGRTWQLKEDDNEQVGYQYCTLYDSGDANTVYSLGVQGHIGDCLFQVSKDGGESWQNVYTKKNTSSEWHALYDVLQDNDNLIMLMCNDVYMVKKSDLNDRYTSIETVTDNGKSANDKIYTLDGKQLGTNAVELPNGIYIKNGKKISLKN